MEPNTRKLSEPVFDPKSGLWFYGNANLLATDVAKVSDVTRVGPCEDMHNADRRLIEKSAEALVLDSRTLVVGIHNEAHQQAAVVPLRWGCPRILVLSGGFRSHLGDELMDEPFEAARLWRLHFDRLTDLCVSEHDPDAEPANSTWAVERLIDHVVDNAAEILVGLDATLAQRIAVDDRL